MTHTYADSSDEHCQLYTVIVAMESDNSEVLELLKQCEKMFKGDC